MRVFSNWADECHGLRNQGRLQQRVPRNCASASCPLTMRLSDAGLRRRKTKLIYPNHRLTPWLIEDSTPRSLEPIVRCLAPTLVRKIAKPSKFQGNRNKRIHKSSPRPPEQSS